MCRDNPSEYSIDKSIQPLMSEFGAAVFDAQVVEYSIELILELIEHSNQPTEDIPRLEDIFIKPSKHTLGKLLRTLLDQQDLTNESINLLLKTLEIRNILVHRFFQSKSRLIAALTPAGIISLVDELRTMRHTLKAAGQLLDKILDLLLVRYDSSIADLKKKAAHEYLTSKKNGGLGSCLI